MSRTAAACKANVMVAQIDVNAVVSCLEAFDPRIPAEAEYIAQSIAMALMAPAKLLRSGFGQPD